MKVHCEPAFPSNNPLYKGMTLRDYFAGQALVGVSTSPSAYGCSSSKEIVYQAYKIADAMLKERDA